MQRSHLLALCALLVALAAGAAWLFLGAAPVAPPVEPSHGPSEAVASVAAVAQPGAPTDATETADRRQSAAAVEAGVAEDPDILAALCGFRGRVVDHEGQPVSDCGVRLYRGALDSVLTEGLDLFADDAAMVPNYVAGETKTDTAGRFLLPGVWPNAFFVLLAGVGTDAPTHVVLQQSVAPGEVHDLGDIVLELAAVAIGRVVDELGEPVADALVRAVDLPGQVLSFVPLERFDPRGAVIVRDAGAPVSVVEVPAWAASAFEHLPIPMTRTDGDGAFRLVGIRPGSNVFAVTHDDHAPDVRPTVAFAAGETKDMGTVRLRDGEELGVRVIDTLGEPVAGAEVIAGSVSMAAPVDFARRLSATDADGRTQGLGFGAGRASVAARRSARDPWVRVDPQPILSDIVVTLPATAGLAVQVLLQGSPVAAPELRLYAGKSESEVLTMALMGVVRPIELEGRTRKLDDGRTAIEDLPVDTYVVVARAEGAAFAAARVDANGGLVPVQIDLQPAEVFVVRVLGPGDKPVRNAAIYAQESGGRPGGGVEAPLMAGRTDAAGRLVVDCVQTGVARFSATHPRYGAVHTMARRDSGEVLLRFQEPGWIEGTLVDGGKPVTSGEWGMVAEWRRGDSPRGAADQVPVMAVVGVDGAFRFPALQPGTWRVRPMPALQSLHSPGGVMEIADSMWRRDSSARVEVEVLANAATAVEVDVAGKPYTGPTATLSGTVTIDGRLAEGSAVFAITKGGRRTAVVDAAGRYDFAAIPAGDVNLWLNAKGSMFERKQLWNERLELKDGEIRQLDVTVDTCSISGYVTLPDGKPAANIRIESTGNFGSKEHQSPIWNSTRTDANGHFQFEMLPAGSYTLEVDGGDDDHVRGVVRGMEMTPGAHDDGVRLQLVRAIHVAGRVDFSAVGGRQGWAWIQFRRPSPEHPADRQRAQHVASCGVRGEQFETWELDPGTYYVEVHLQMGEEYRSSEVVQQLVVPAAGLDAVTLVLAPLKAK